MVIKRKEPATYREAALQLRGVFISAGSSLIVSISKIKNREIVIPRSVLTSKATGIKKQTT